MKRLLIPNEVFFEWAEQMLRQGQEIELSVKGQSMRPFLWDGEKVTVVPVQPQQTWQKGMIILAKVKGQVMMHRIFRLENGTILMKGDGNLLQTEQIHPCDVMGIAKWVHRNGKQLSLDSFSQRTASWFWRNGLIRRMGLRLFYLWNSNGTSSDKK